MVSGISRPRGVEAPAVLAHSLEIPFFLLLLLLLLLPMNTLAAPAFSLRLSLPHPPVIAMLYVFLQTHHSVLRVTSHDPLLPP